MFSHNVYRMIIKIGKYAFGFLGILLTSGCAASSFEWVKVNPEKIQLAKSRAPYNDSVRQVNLVFQLKEKDNVVYYAESSGFFAPENNTTELAGKALPLKHNIKKSHYPSKGFIASRTTNSQKNLNNSVVFSQPKPASTNVSDADKLNSALKIPLIKTGKNVASFGPSASEVREMAFNTIKEKNPEIAEKSAANEQRGKNLMWAGLVLVVLGGIMGFIFGKSAFLISLAGVVFATVGYFFKL